MPSTRAQELEDQLKVIRSNIDWLLRKHWPERGLYLLGAFSALALLLYLIYGLASQTTTLADSLGALFGSSGVVGSMCALLGWQLRRSLRLIERVIEARLGLPSDRKAQKATDAN